jgi:hypothetical protein
LMSLRNSGSKIEGSTTWKMAPLAATGNKKESLPWCPCPKLVILFLTSSMTQTRRFLMIWLWTALWHAETVESMSSCARLWKLRVLREFVKIMERSNAMKAILELIVLIKCLRSLNGWTLKDTRYSTMRLLLLNPGPSLPRLLLAGIFTWLKTWSQFLRNSRMIYS